MDIIIIFHIDTYGRKTIISKYGCNTLNKVSSRNRWVKDAIIILESALDLDNGHGLYYTKNGITKKLDYYNLGLDDD